jgi:D-arabinose 1-dehydrogenase-like Zn-dependent alcohol dehydrogenase
MNEKVKALVVTGFKKIELRKLNKPKLGKKDLLMKIRYCGICGSDIHFWEESIQPSYPYIPGHEFIGEVA